MLGCKTIFIFNNTIIFMLLVFDYLYHTVSKNIIIMAILKIW